MVREIREELDCTIRVKEIVDLVYHAYPDFDLIMPVYRASIVAGRARACQVASIAWVPRRRLAEMTMPPADVPLAKKLSRTQVRR